ncbi:profilin [Russula compacta]|nr:profilin [Russula compacta]
MSWQGGLIAYVDTNLVGSGKVSRAAILGQSGGVWAASQGYSLTPDEQKAIRESFSNPDKAFASGIKLAGKKYFTIQANDRSVYVKKGGDGAVLVKTKQAVLVAEYAAPVQAPETTPVVEGLADYLISVEY